MGMVMSIDTQHGWYYNSCMTCTKKVYPKSSTWYCSKCNVLVKYVIPRYSNYPYVLVVNVVLLLRVNSKSYITLFLINRSKVEMKVVDDTSDVVF